MGISKQMQLEEMHRISVEEYGEDDLSDARAKNDDAAFCAKENYDSEIAAAVARRQYDNDELVEVIEAIQNKMENDK